MDRSIVPRDAPSDLPVARSSAFRPTLMERVGLSRWTPRLVYAVCFAAVSLLLLTGQISTIWECLVAGLPFALPLVALHVWIQFRPQRLANLGENARALWFTERLLADPSLLSGTLPRQRMQLIQASLLSMTGEFQHAKAVLAALDREGVAAAFQPAKKAELALLYLRLGDAESALAIVEESDTWRLPGNYEYLRPLIRSIGRCWVGDHAASRQSLSEAQQLANQPLARAHCLDQEAFLELQAGGGATSARERIALALRLVPTDHPSRVAFQLDDIWISLDCGECPVEALQRLETLAPRLEERYGSLLKAQFHYLRARCFEANGQLDDARIDIGQLDDFPASPYLKRRIAELAGRLEAAAGPHE